MGKILLSLFLLIFIGKVEAYPFDYKYYNHWKAVYHPHNESSYQHAYCSIYNGIEEYQLPDKTKVDCLTSKNAIEFDFANKWQESVGQALHYGLMTNKKPKIVLILDNKYKRRQMVYYNRIKKIGQAYNIDVEYISDEILNINNKGKCQYKNCKCNLKNKHLKF